MCKQLFMNSSYYSKHFLIFGSLVTLGLSVALGYKSYTLNQIYSDIDQTMTQDVRYIYIPQMANVIYLGMIAFLSSYVLIFEQRTPIRTLPTLTTTNAVLAIWAIIVALGGTNPEQLLGPRLNPIAVKYDFSFKGPEISNVTEMPAAKMMNANNITGNSSEPRARYVEQSFASNSSDATRIWDSLQANGCCGFKAANETWSKIPKSCCSKPIISGGEKFCESNDSDHKRGCLELVESTNMTIITLLFLTLLMDCLLTYITGVKAIMSFHYSRASQNSQN